MPVEPTAAVPRKSPSRIPDPVPVRTWLLLEYGVLTSKGKLKFHQHIRTKKTGRKVVKFTDFCGGLPETKNKLSGKPTYCTKRTERKKTDSSLRRRRREHERVG